MNTYVATYDIKLELLKTGEESPFWSKTVKGEYEPDKVKFETIKTVIIRLINDSWPEYLTELSCKSGLTDELDKHLQKASKPANDDLDTGDASETPTDQ